MTEKSVVLSPRVTMADRAAIVREVKSIEYAQCTACNEIFPIVPGADTYAAHRRECANDWPNLA